MANNSVKGLEIKKGDYFHFKNLDYIVVLEVKNGIVRYRAVKSCKGKCSDKNRIGEPYTFQGSRTIKNFKRNILRKYGHELILKILFRWERRK